MEVHPPGLDPVLREERPHALGDRVLGVAEDDDQRLGPSLVVLPADLPAGGFVRRLLVAEEVAKALRGPFEDAPGEALALLADLVGDVALGDLLRLLEPSFEHGGASGRQTIPKRATPPGLRGGPACGIRL